MPLLMLLQGAIPSLGHWLRPHFLMYKLILLNGNNFFDVFSDLFPSLTLMDGELTLFRNKAPTLYDF